MQFNEYLRACRENYNLTQEELVDALYSHDQENFSKLDSTTLSKWERDLIKPKLIKQVSIIKYFQKQSHSALPCFDEYTIEETEKLICKTGMKNLIGKNKQYIFNFPADTLKIDDMEIHPIRNSRTEAILDIHMNMHENLNHSSTAISFAKFREWAMHPYNTFFFCEYKGAFLGYFFTIRVKPEIFEKILNFEMHREDIRQEDLASYDEMGSYIILSFFAMNEKSATLLFIRFYAHLIANQKHIKDIGGITKVKEATKIVSRMNLDLYNSTVTQDNITIESYRQTLNDTLASENVVKMLLSKQTCPEESEVD